MLKIGTVKWRGKCSKHPAYDPSSDGEGAIKGNCAKCHELAEIFDHHRKALRLMRNFQPPGEKRKTIPELIDLQLNLFG